MQLKFIQFFLVTTVLLSSFPNDTRVAVAEEKPVVFVSILPQKYFVEKLAGDTVDVEVMVPPGASPATYEPRPSQMTKLAKAKVYYSIGVPFEFSWLPRLHSVAPNLTLVATDQEIQKRAIDHHSHYPGSSTKIDRHAIADPHIWLSPPLVKLQAEKIAQSLVSLFPEQAEVIKRHLDQFIMELEQLDNKLHKVFQQKKGLHFMVFHPSWGYFADQYGLIQEPIEFSGKKPKPAQLAKLISIAKTGEIKTILVQPQFSQKSARLIAKEIGGKAVIADPLAVDWAVNLQRIAHLIARED